MFKSTSSAFLPNNNNPSTSTAAIHFNNNYNKKEYDNYKEYNKNNNDLMLKYESINSFYRMTNNKFVFQSLTIVTNILSFLFFKMIKINFINFPKYKNLNFILKELNSKMLINQTFYEMILKNYSEIFYFILLQKTFVNLFRNENLLENSLQFLKNNKNFSSNKFIYKNLNHFWNLEKLKNNKKLEIIKKENILKNLNEKDQFLKITIFGDENYKILEKYLQKSQENIYDHSLQEDSYFNKVKIYNNNYYLEILNISLNEESSTTLLEQYFKSADILLFIFNINNFKNNLKKIENFIDICFKTLNKEIPIIICGNFTQQDLHLLKRNSFIKKSNNNHYNNHYNNSTNLDNNNKENIRNSVNNRDSTNNNDLSNITNTADSFQSIPIDDNPLLLSGNNRVIELLEENNNSEEDNNIDDNITTNTTITTRTQLNDISPLSSFSSINNHNLPIDDVQHQHQQQYHFTKQDNDNNNVINSGEDKDSNVLFIEVEKEVNEMLKFKYKGRYLIGKYIEMSIDLNRNIIEVFNELIFPQFEKCKQLKIKQLLDWDSVLERIVKDGDKIFSKSNNNCLVM
ncbi:hypothetical protein ABK040_012404 [Willaertia magna]